MPPAQANEMDDMQVLLLKELACKTSRFDLSTAESALSLEHTSPYRHAIRELAPIHGINLGFQNFVGFLLVGNSLREPRLLLLKNRADCWNWSIDS